MPRKSDGMGGLDKDVGLALALLRTVRRLSQQELAKRSGVRGASISEIEQGKKLPALPTLYQLLGALDVSLSTLEATQQFIEEVRNPPRTWRDKRSLTADLEAACSEVGQTAVRVTRMLFSLLQDRTTPLPAWRADIAENPASLEAARSQVLELWGRLRKLSPKMQQALIENESEFHSLALAAFLASRSVVAAGHDPRKALALAELAVAVARRVSGTPSLRNRVTGYALAHLANAYRVSGDLPAAERTFREAETYWLPWDTSSPDLLDDASFYALKASLRRTQGEFAEALALHEQALGSRGAEAIYPQLLVSKAYTLDEQGNLPAVIETLEKASSSLTGTEDPRLILALRHNLVDALSKAGQFEEADAFLPEVKRLAGTGGSDLDFARVQWVEGRVKAGLGKVDEAVALLSRVRGALASAGMVLDTALVTLELSFFYIQQGRLDAVRDLARNLAPIFKAQGLPLETLAALQLFRQAAEKQAVSKDLVLRLVAYLRKSRYQPEARFEE